MKARYPKFRRRTHRRNPKIPALARQQCAKSLLARVGQAPCCTSRPASMPRVRGWVVTVPKSKDDQRSFMRLNYQCTCTGRVLQEMLPLTNRCGEVIRTDSHAKRTLLAKMNDKHAACGASTASSSDSDMEPRDDAADNTTDGTVVQIAIIDQKLPIVASCFSSSSQPPTTAANNSNVFTHSWVFHACFAW